MFRCKEEKAAELVLQIPGWTLICQIRGNTEAVTIPHFSLPLWNERSLTISWFNDWLLTTDRRHECRRNQSVCFIWRCFRLLSSHKLCDQRTNSLWAAFILLPSLKQSVFPIPDRIPTHRLCWQENLPHSRCTCERLWVYRKHACTDAFTHKRTTQTQFISTLLSNLLRMSAFYSTQFCMIVF